MSNPQEADKFAPGRYTREEIDMLRQGALATESEDEATDAAAPDPEEGKVDESPNDASNQLEPRPASPELPISPPSASATGAANIRRGMRVPARTEFRRRMLQRGGEGSVLEKMEKIKPGQARRRLKQGLIRLPMGGEVPRIKDPPAIPVQVTGKNQEGLPADALPKITPYYGSTTPQPTKAPSKAPSKAPTKQPTEAPSFRNPLEQFKGAFGRKEGRDVEAEMKRGELRRRKR